MSHRGNELVGRPVYAGVFVVSLATLMFQLLLTRIFSVTMWYHYAFMAISLAMFGMTVGALIVYLRPAWFPEEGVHRQLARASLLFPVLIVVALVTHLCIPFPKDPSVVGILSIAINYTVIAVPFVASGVCIALALTRFPAHVGSLYASDLVGASVGCVGMVVLLHWMDGPSAVLMTAAIAAIGPVCFARALEKTRTKRLGTALALGLAALATINASVVRDSGPGLRPVWVKGRAEEPPILERWNSFSRVAVWGPYKEGAAIWGMSAKVPKFETERYVINIDASASTDVTRFDGDLEKLAWLRYDITNLAHRIRQRGSVMVIGVGGGRDILSALSFGHERIVGVELNGRIVDAVTGTYGDFSGHLDRVPGVTIVNDEARSYASRSGEKFDVIEASLIDTWAATAAGAFVLGESALYTTDGWRILMGRLDARGVLTFSRWYRRDAAEVYRLVALATQTLLDLGVSEPRRNIMLVRHMGNGGSEGPEGIGTILVSPSPFSAEDVATIRGVTADLGFEIMLSPEVAVDPMFATITASKDLVKLADGQPFDISPPTDDRPFFFQMLRPRDVVSPHLESEGWRTNALAVLVLFTILATVMVLTTLCIVVPLWMTSRRKEVLAGSSPLFAYFMGIGFGFMLVEMAMMQRLNLFLGHPVYGATVVLCSMLLSGGLGSWLSQRWVTKIAGPRAVRCLVALIAVVLAWSLASPAIFARFISHATPVRITIAALTIAPVATLMGMGFPIGMRVAAARGPAITPWLWGANGATSVCASVLAIVISLASSISTALFVGVACYLVSLAAFFRARGAETATAPAVVLDTAGS
ncbi:MAG: hypothetical protein KF819_14875 [Labilithrix sp.]|nr:hypothetical protein [Labilithrix sp.]